MYAKLKNPSYNSRMPTVIRCLALLLLVVSASAQEANTTTPLAIVSTNLPPASLWNHYGDPHSGFILRSEGGVGLHRWRIRSGSLPSGMRLEEHGTISGSPQESGEFEFTILLMDATSSVQRKFTLTVETPLVTDWNHKAQVSGQRIDGSVKVSNRSGRDFDLTFIVLAVNDIGRATAIGYQHFPLKANTRDLDLPFGDTISAGNYVVHVDLVGEEPISKRIFRARLVTGKQSIAPGL